ncbi:MAG TPA: gamma-glutamyltransferase [Polyangiaceae bacterium]|nr:gamma-glutamyltransferase [Polyangiaceae bacterium]
MSAKSSISIGASCLRGLRSPGLWATGLAMALLLSAPQGEAKDEKVAGRAAAATEHPLATRTALSVLRQGGNAADAAVAAALMAGVVSPSSSGLGGGGFALVYSPKLAAPVALDFREVAPQGVDAAILDRRPLPPEQRGALVGVPGEARGLEWLQQRFGSLSFASLVAHAEQRARQGFAVGPHLARTLAGSASDLTRDASLSSVFFPGGRAAAAGRVVRNPRLAKTLSRLAQQGAQAIYSGPIAAEIARTVQQYGGSLNEHDLTNYAAIERPPLKVTWGEDDVFTMPAPSAGGLLLTQTLSLFSKAELQHAANPQGLPRPAAESGLYLHLLGEAFRASFVDRMAHVGDPALVPDPAPRLLDAAHLNELRKRIAIDRTHSIPLLNTEEHGTHHLVVADAQGMVVSLTTTVNRTFGAKIVTPDSGLVLNDQLDDFALSRDVDHLGAGSRVAPNAPRPGARPVSSMTPSIVLRAGRPILAIGGSGGLTIGTNVTQLLIAHLALGQAPKDMVQRPRIYVPMGIKETLLVDSGFSDAVIEDLTFRGERLAPMKFTGSAVQLLAWDSRGWSAAADPRKFGEAATQ